MAAHGDGPDPLAEGDPAGIGEYTLLARLRESACAVEYLALDREGAKVSVLVPRPRLAADPALSRRFAAEARLAVAAAGPWVPSVRESAVGHLVTAYRPALALGSAIARYGPLPEHALRVLGAALAEALVRLHALAGAHQGLAPHTVLLGADGPRLTGFGPLAAATGIDPAADGAAARLTLGFLTPEQVAGRAPGPASDVFVLGLLLVYAATGAGPFAAATPDAVAAADPDLDGVPAGLRPLLSRCLAKDPGRRPAPGAVATGLAPDGAAALLAAQWLPGALVTELSAQASAVMALEAPLHDGPSATAVTTQADASAPNATAPDAPEPPRRGLAARRSLLLGALATTAGLAGGFALGRGTSRAAAPARPAAAPSGPPARVPGTPPAVLWHFRAGTTGQQALVWNDQVVVVPLIGATIGLDLRTGKTLWTKDIWCNATPVPVSVSEDLLFVPTFDRGLVRFSALTGTAHDTDPAYAMEINDGFVGRAGTRVWFRTPGEAGMTQLVCYDIAQRSTVWRAPLGRVAAGHSGSLRVTPGAGSVYVQRVPDPADANEKDLGAAVFSALDTETGARRWERWEKEPWAALPDEPRSWMTADGTLYTDENHKLCARDVKTGTERWGGEALGSPDRISAPRGALLQDDATLYIVDANNWTHLVDPRNGTIKRTTFPPVPLTSVPKGEAALVAGPSGSPLYRLDWQSVTAVDPQDGRNLWAFQGVAEQAQEQEGLIWRVSSGTRTAVFARKSGRDYFALSVG
ncbi:PQQ-binding-like beta-propeller repeat protein [Streptomyces sp. NPDC048507]|uniref:outer membrane protein assembly factor BamB family protein n=1 Tax=Streptomyces sp. NPDC048507 TaxID=3365560 RepID=UPI00371FED1C